MAESLRHKFFSGMVWTFIQNIAVRALGVVFTIILARLLTPEDYGLIGMLSIFIAISDVFIQSGFGQALVQKTDCSDDDFSTAFYFNVTVSICIYIVLFFCAPAIANFYHEPQLIALTRVLSLNFILGSFNIVQQSKLTKAMNFKPLAVLSLIATSISGVLGVSMAYAGFGVWSLVAQTLTATLLRVIVFPFFTKWHPNRPFNKTSFKHLWGYGSKILVTGVLEVVIRNLSNIVIGRYYDKGQVGYFSKARNFADVPAMMMSSVLGTVTFPLLSEIQEDKSRHTAVYNKVTINTIVLTFPIMILMSLLAEPIVIILFTEKWAPCIPMLQAFLLARMFLPLNMINASVLQSTGATKLYMNLYFITGPISLIAVLVSIPFGALAMAWATLAYNVIYYLVFTIVIGRRINYRFHKQLWNWRRIILSLSIMSICVYLSIHWISGMWTKVIIGGIVGTIIYLICCKLFNLIDEDVQNVLLSKLKMNRK